MFDKFIRWSDYHKQYCLICSQSSDTLICTYCCEDMHVYSYKGNLLALPHINKLFPKRHFNVLRALMPYGPPVSHLINQMKFSSNTLVAHGLADLFITHFHTHIEAKHQVLMPVPLHAYRYVKRKYNQSGLIAQKLAQHWQIAYQPWAVERVKATRAQSSIQANLRRTNLKQAFKVNTRLSCNHIILFDDVITTGSTVNSLAKMLKAQNPDLTVEIWCLCVTHLR